jgi:hypothetical protein
MDEAREEREELEQLERDVEDLRREQEAEERWTEVVEPDERRMP